MKGKEMVECHVSMAVGQTQTTEIKIHVRRLNPKAATMMIFKGWFQNYSENNNHVPTGTVKRSLVAVSFLMFIQAIQRPPPLVLGGTKVLILCKNIFKS